MQDNPLNMTDPSGHDATGTAAGLGGTITIGGILEGLTLPAINGARVWAMARIGVIVGTVAVTLSGDRSRSQNANPFLMRLQFQESDKFHYWSAPIAGKQIPGTNPPRYEPVTKRQVLQEQLGLMFSALKAQDYVLEEGWKPYRLGSDEPRLWSAIIRMSMFVQGLTGE